MKSAHARVAAACLVGWAGLAAPVSAGPLDANRRLILTDNAFTADKYILDQACLMVELYYRMDEDEGLLFDPEAPDVIFGRVFGDEAMRKAAE